MFMHQFNYVNGREDFNGLTELLFPLALLCFESLVLK